MAKPEIVDDVPLVIQVNANGPSSVHTSVSNGPRDRPSDSTGTDQHSALQGDSLTDSRSNQVPIPIFSSSQYFIHRGHRSGLQNPPATQDESRRKSFINARHDWVRGRRQLDNVRLFSAPSDGGTCSASSAIRVSSSLFFPRFRSKRYAHQLRLGRQPTPPSPFLVLRRRGRRQTLRHSEHSDHRADVNAKGQVRGSAKTKMKCIKIDGK